MGTIQLSGGCTLQNELIFNMFLKLMDVILKVKWKGISVANIKPSNNFDLHFYALTVPYLLKYEFFYTTQCEIVCHSILLYMCVRSFTIHIPALAHFNVA